MEVKETIEDISLFDFIDSGCFSETFKSKKKGSDKIYATKKMELDIIEKIPNIKEFIDNEIYILNKIKHPNIVKLYEVKKTPKYMYLIMEYCNGGSLYKNLTEYIEKNEKPFTEDIVKFLMKQILAGVECLHKNKVIHCDLKLDNILLKYNSDSEANISNIFRSQVKIIDFNISVIQKKSDKSDQIYINGKSIKGYKDPKYDEKKDIMALGVLCYQMLYGKKPFEYGNNNKEIKNKDKIKNRPHLSSEAKSFLYGMLQKDSNKRSSATELLNHAFIKNNVNNENLNYMNIIQDRPINSKDIIGKSEYISKKSQQPQPIFKKYMVGHRINSQQSDIIIKACKKYYKLIKDESRSKTAKKVAEELKGELGYNWLVMISDLNCGQFDFSLSPAKKGDFIVFSFDKKLFQICRY
jgi:calcium-dependent protein kinase